MARRGYKRDTRGRFSRIAGTKVSSKAVVPRRTPKRTVRPPLNAAARRARGKKILRNVKIARGTLLVGAAAYAAYDLNSSKSPSLRARRMHAQTMGERITRANTRGLGAMTIARQNRRGVYRVTSL